MRTRKTLYASDATVLEKRFLTTETATDTYGALRKHVVKYGQRADKNERKRQEQAKMDVKSFRLLCTPAEGF